MADNCPAVLQGLRLLPEQEGLPICEKAE